MNPCSVDIVGFLEDESDLGLVKGDNLHISREPSSPNFVVTIYDPAGGTVDFGADAKANTYSHHPIQVRIRHTNYTDGWDMAQKIYEFLHGLHGLETDDAYYALITATTPPTFLEWDENNRIVFIVNFDVQRRAKTV